MRTHIKLLAVALLFAPVAPLGAAAQTSNPDAVAAAERMCDYCADYTDAGASPGLVRSAYLPVVGYAGAFEQAAAATGPQASGADYQIRLFRIESK